MLDVGGPGLVMLGPLRIRHGSVRLPPTGVARFAPNRRWTVKKRGRKRLASERLVTGKRQVHRICRTTVTRTLVAD